MNDRGDRKPENARDVSVGQVVVDDRPTPVPVTPRILVTNDDGIDAPGIRTLAARLSGDYDVIVAAPRTDMSGTGTGIGRFDPQEGVALDRRDIDGVAAAYAVDGPPGLAVMAAGLGAFGARPDLVVSGINAGLNTGHAIIHSGTVGAALTARTFGSHGIAVSLSPSEPWHWDTAAEIAASAASWVLERDSHRTVLNINVPGRPIDRLAGVHWADMDEFGHFRVAVADLPGQRLQFEVTSERAEADSSTDTGQCRDGAVTLTLLSSLEPAAFPSDPATEVWTPPAGM